MGPTDDAWGPVPPDGPDSAHAAAPADVPATAAASSWPSFGLGDAPGRDRRRQRRRILVGALGAVVIGTLGVLVFGSGASPPGAGMSPVVFVGESTQNTLNHRTADVVLSGTVRAAGHALPIHGTGQCDFTKGAMSMEMQEQVRNVSVDIRILALDHALYFGFTANGQDLSTITGGPHWVSMPAPAAKNGLTLGSGASDPSSELQLLEQQGNTVRPLGTDTVDGVEVSGFAVTPSRETIVQGITEELLSTDLPAALRQQLQAAEVNPPSITLRVWFDRNALLRKMSADLALPSLGASGTNVGGTVDMVFSDYGAPVDVSAPSPSDVISISAFSDLVAGARQT